MRRASSPSEKRSRIAGAEPPASQSWGYHADHSATATAYIMKTESELPIIAFEEYLCSIFKPTYKKKNNLRKENCKNVTTTFFQLIHSRKTHSSLRSIISNLGCGCSTLVEPTAHNQEVVDSNPTRCLALFFSYYLFLLSFTSGVSSIRSLKVVHL